jgi:hypothetical protein
MMIMASGAESRTLLTSSEESMDREDCIARRASQARIRSVAYAAAAGTEARAPAALHSDRMDNRVTRAWQSASFASLPMLGAIAGAACDERHHLGFTTWRTVCRSTQVNIPTLVDFTLQLLPWAVIGLLLGGLAVLAVGVLLRRRFADTCVAAHASCAVTLPAMLVLCAFLPPAWTLAADAVLATLAAWLLLALVRTPSRATGTHP